MFNVNRCSRYKRNNKFGIKDKITGYKFTDAIYEDIRRITGTDYYVKVKIDGMWGVAKIVGDLILINKYEDIIDYDGEYFTVVINNEKSKARNPLVYYTSKVIEEYNNISPIPSFSDKDKGVNYHGFFRSGLGYDEEEY